MAEKRTRVPGVTKRLDAYHAKGFKVKPTKKKAKRAKSSSARRRNSSLAPGSKPVRVKSK